MRDFIRHYMDNITVGSPLIFTIIVITATILSISFPPLYILSLLAGFGVLILVNYKPELGILIIVILISSIVFEESLPLIPIGIGSFHLTDVLIIFMLITLPYKYLTNKNFSFAESPLNKPLILFFLLSIISAVLSVIIYGVDFNEVARSFRKICYYLIFFLITNLLTNKSQIRFLVKGLFTISAVVASTMIIQAMVGDSIQLTPGRIEAAATFGTKFDAVRILPPGQTLIFLAFITSISLQVFEREKSLLFSGTLFLSFLLGTGLILTYNRSYWVAVILCIMILAAITARDSRKRLTALLLSAVIFFGSSIVMFSGAEGKLSETIDAVEERITSLFAGKDLIESSSLEDRRIENNYAIQQIKLHPLIGSGLANTYRPSIYGPNDKLANYVHNGYLWLIMNLGAIGFFFFIWFYFGFLIRAFKHISTVNDDYLKGILVGLLLSGVGIVPMNFVNPMFMQGFSIVVMSIAIGLTEVIIRIELSDDSDSRNESERVDG